MALRYTIVSVDNGTDLVCQFVPLSRSATLTSLVVMGPSVPLNVWSPQYLDPYSLITTTDNGGNNHAEFQYPHLLNRGDTLYVQWVGGTGSTASATATFDDGLT